ncbi:DUF4249 domain-containing protein [Algoriphagus sp. PAP.12]|uniref:DUF4249 domain-containing protein n=1 Tax=Algoriphagus sp. PAP.12 TaxID=2996678 RepID=UPI00227B25D2|nr:DUF4249 domain-containing protein [Algoriphagus sp. PAP.12]
MKFLGNLGNTALLSLLVFLTSCREEFVPDIEAQATGILVVEGYLDSEGLSSDLKLSFTSSISDSYEPSALEGASIQLISESGEAYSFSEKGDGIYTFQQDLDEAKIYNLNILLPNGNEFSSDPIQPIITPPILEAGFVRDENGVEIFVNTQGDENADDFLWTYEETWILRPRIRSPYIFDKDLNAVRTRTEQERVDLCYRTVESPDILLETSSRFENQVVFRQTISEIPTNDQRLAEKYSVLISQKALDAKAVEFWEILKKNSLDLGTFFSPLPSIISGNIHAKNGDSRAVGYVSIGVVRQERIFVENSEVRPWFFSDPEFDDCFVSQDALTIGTDIFNSTFGGSGVSPVRELMQGTTIVGYYYAPTRCVDCTLYGTNEKPDFWIE